MGSQVTYILKVGTYKYTSQGYVYRDEGVRFSDLNGDGFVDIIQARQGCDSNTDGDFSDSGMDVVCYTNVDVWLWDPVAAGYEHSSVAAVNFRNSLNANQAFFSMARFACTPFLDGTLIQDLNSDGLVHNCVTKTISWVRLSRLFKRCC